LAWFIGIRVDNASYVIQGRRDEFSLNYTEGATVSTYIMPTQTRFSIAAGPVLVNLTYLTPIEVRENEFVCHGFPLKFFKLQDWTLHSLPFAYAAVDIISSDGSPHAIQLYTDATGRKCSLVRTYVYVLWIYHFRLGLVSSDDTSMITWNTSLTAKSIYHVLQQRTLQTLTEHDDMSEDGSLIWAYMAVIHFSFYQLLRCGVITN